MNNKVRDCLLKQFNISWQLLMYHMNGLTIEEVLWKPASNGVYLTCTDEQTWVGHLPASEAYDIGPTNIAWLTWHIDYWWSMVINHSFEDKTLDHTQVRWRPSVSAITDRFSELKNRWTLEIERLPDDLMSSEDLAIWPIRGCPFSDIVAWLNVELMKNAAEIGLIRFLYASRNKTEG